MYKIDLVRTSPSYQSNYWQDLVIDVSMLDALASARFVQYVDDVEFTYARYGARTIEDSRKYCRLAW